MDRPGKKSNVAEARPSRRRHSRNSDASGGSGGAYRPVESTDRKDATLRSSTSARPKRAMRTESGDTHFFDGRDDPVDLLGDKTQSRKANVVESKRSRQRRAANPAQTRANSDQRRSFSGTQQQGIGLVPMDGKSTLKTVHSRLSGTSLSEAFGLESNEVDPLATTSPVRHDLSHEDEKSRSVDSSGEHTINGQLSNPGDYDTVPSADGKQKTASQSNGRPTSTGHMPKPRPVSHRKHHSKPPPPPPGPNRRSPNKGARGADQAPAGLKRGGKKASSSSRMVSSNSFLGASIFNMSFLLAKPPPAKDSAAEDQEDKSSTSNTTLLDTNRYRTNESALPRLASFYGANKAAINPATGFNTHLHPAAAGASFILPSRPRAPKLSPSDRNRGIPLTVQRSSIDELDEEYGYGMEFPPDCGPTLDEKILSYQYAMRVAAFNHAGTIDSDGMKFVPHPLDSDFGWFALPLQSLFGSDKPDSNILVKYGIGINLWFKFLKAFGVIFFVMFLLTLPSLILFTSGDYLSSSERAFMVQSSPTDLIFATTIGNIAEPGALCFEADPKEEVLLDCGGSNSQIESISVFYGYPHGSCHCPSIQQPLKSGSCAGKIKQKSGKEECSRDLYGNLEACFYSELETHGFPPQPCCAFSKDNGTPDLSELKIKPDYECNSLTAQYIAEGVCLGKSSCVLTSDPLHEYSWTSTSQEDFSSDICSSITNLNNEKYECNSTLGYAGSWASCVQDGGKTDDGRYLMVQAICSTDDIYVLGSPISRADIVTLSSILNAVAMAVFIFGVYWVAHQQRMEEVYMDRNTCRSKDFTVRLDVIPEHTSTHVLDKKLKRHFEKTLSECKPCYLPGVVRVADINFTTGGYKVLQAAINRGRAARQLDNLLYKKNNLEMLLRDNTWEYKLLAMREQRAMESYEKWNSICMQGTNEGNIKVIRSYITFESEEGFLRCLKHYQPRTFGAFFDNEDLHLDGKRLKVHPAEDPSDILWENLGTPRIQQFCGRLFTTLLLIALLAVTYFVVDNAIRAGRVYEDDFPKVVDCADYRVSLDKSENSTAVSTITYERTVRDVKWQYYNNTDGRQGFLQCYCEKIFRKNGLNSMMDYKFYDESEGRQEEWCRGVVMGFVNVTIIRLVVAIVVVAVNISAKSILRALKDFERRNSQTEISESMTLKLFVVQVVNTGLLVVLMNGRVSGFENSVISFLNGRYPDFTSSWYSDVGISLVGTMALYMFGVHGLKVLTFFAAKFWRWRDKHFSSDTRLTNQVSQEQLNMLYVGPEFVIEVRYATALTICFVCITFAPGMPLMYFIMAMAFGILYFVDKFYFLRVSRIPRAVSPSLAHSVTKSFYLAAFLNLSVAVWTYSNIMLFAPEVNKKRTFETYDGMEFMRVDFELNGFATLPERLFNNWTATSWMLLFPLVLLVGYIFLHDIIRSILFVFGMKIVERRYEGNPEYFDSIPLPLLKRRVDDGIVKKHIGDRYKKRIKDLEANPVEIKQLEGLDSYDISLNEIYADKLAINTDYIAQKRPPDLFKDDMELGRGMSSEDVDDRPGKTEKERKEDNRKSSQDLSFAKGPASRDGKPPSGSRRGSTGGSGKNSMDGERGKADKSEDIRGRGEEKSVVSGIQNGHALGGQHSSSFVSLYPDEKVEEVMDVTELFF